MCFLIRLFLFAAHCRPINKHKECGKRQEHANLAIEALYDLDKTAVKQRLTARMKDAG